MKAFVCIKYARVQLAFYQKRNLTGILKDFDYCLRNIIFILDEPARKRSHHSGSVKIEYIANKITRQKSFSKRKDTLLKLVRPGLLHYHFSQSFKKVLQFIIIAIKFP